MSNRFSKFLSLFLVLFLQACQQPTRQSTASERERCRAQAENEFTTNESEKSYANCLQEMRKKPTQAVPASPAPSEPSVQPGTPTARIGQERYIYCVLHQQETIDLSKQLDKATSMVLQASTRPGSSTNELASAEIAHTALIKRLEQLIPTEYRNGLPLIPDALTAFSKCDKEALK